jgi:iron(III) transport system ATP-binding protein
MFEVRGVSREFPGRPAPVRALHHVDLDAADGRITALLGPSGSGKTTLLRILAGFDRPDAGEVRLAGRVVAGPGVFVPPERRKIGVVTQEGSLFPHLDVAANVAYGLPGGWRRFWSGEQRSKRAARVQELLEMVGLRDYGRRRPDELSGGQQQRVALARALAPAPSVILLDEPFSALDSGLRVELREEVVALLRSIDTTAVLVTHDQGEALSLADHVVILRAGEVVQAGPPAELYAHPADAGTADLLGDVVLMPAQVVSCSAQGVAEAECALGRVRVDCKEATEGGSCTLVLRPEQLRLDAPGTPARVLATSFYGHDGMVRLQLTDLDVQVLVRMLGPLPEVGREVHVQFSPDAVAHAVAVHAPVPAVATAAAPV